MSLDPKKYSMPHGRTNKRANGKKVAKWMMENFELKRLRNTSEHGKGLRGLLMHVILCLFWIGFATWGIHEITGIEE